MFENNPVLLITDTKILFTKYLSYFFFDFSIVFKLNISNFVLYYDMRGQVFSFDIPTNTSHLLKIFRADHSARGTNECLAQSSDRLHPATKCSNVETHEQALSGAWGIPWKWEKKKFEIQRDQGYQEIPQKRLNRAHVAP